MLFCLCQNHCSVEINTLVINLEYFFLAAFTSPIFSKKWKIHGMKSNLSSPAILPNLLIAWGLNLGRLGTSLYPVIMCFYSSYTFTSSFCSPLENNPACAFSDIHALWLVIYLVSVVPDNVSLVWFNLNKARLNCVDGMALASSQSWR